MTTTALPARTLRDDFRQIVTMAGLVAALLSMISLGLPAILAWITEKLGPAVPIWKAFATTAPLTAAVAFVLVGLIRGWLAGVFELVFTSAAAIVVTSGCARLVGMPGWVDFTARWRELPSGVLELPIAIVGLFLQNYWRIYGPQLFASSIVVGCFLAWAWGVKLLPHWDRRCTATAAESSDELQRPTRRKAA